MRFTPKRVDSNSNIQSNLLIQLHYRKDIKQVLGTLINLANIHLKTTIETLKLLFNIFKILFNKNTCFLENLMDSVRLLPEITNSAKIHDIGAIHAKIEILLN